jgi:DNA-directed RNA polymerase specialized sigma54-like protein
VKAEASMNGKISSRKLAKKVEEKFYIGISYRSIRRYRHSLSIHAYKPISSPKVELRHIV